MKCPTCGRASLVKDCRDITHIYKGEHTVIADVWGEFCPACEEALLAPDESGRVMSEMRRFNSHVNASITAPSALPKELDMLDESPKSVAIRVQSAITDGAAIPYGADFPDKEYPEIVWAMFGLTATNEIAVTADVGTLRLGLAELSPLLWPAMVDRMFGMDFADVDLALSLSEQLWNANSDRLISEALLVRQTRS